MKKFKKLLLAATATVSAFAMIFSVACSGSCSGDPKEPEDPTPPPADTGIAGPGLKVSLAEGVSDTITLSTTETTASIDLSKIKVEVVSETGESLKTLTTDDYTAELYQGETKLTETSGLKGGVYQIWATTKEAYSEDTSWYPSNFVLVYVMNDLTSLTWNSAAEGTLTEQESGSKDTISSTWKFTATYANGETRDLTEDDKVTFEGLEVKTVGEDKVATASYTEKNVKGEDVTKTAEVTYTITAPSKPAATESFLVPDEEVTGDAATVTEGTNIADNTLFTVKASGDMVYSIGKSATEGVGNTSKAVTVELQDGTSKTFKQGLKQKDAVNPDGATATKAITVTAKVNATVRVYIGLANDSFNSDRPSVIKYQVDDGTAQSATISKREQIATIEVALTAGQTLTITGVVDLNTEKPTNTGKLWLFGVEAEKVNSDVDLDMATVPPTELNNSDNKTYYVGGQDVALGEDTGIFVTQGDATNGDNKNQLYFEYSKKATSDDAEEEYTTRLRFSKAATQTTSSLKIVTEGECDITIWVRSGTNAETRYVQFYDSNFNAINDGKFLIGATEESKTAGDGLIYKVTIHVSAAGTYYFGSVAGTTVTGTSIGIYRVKVEY